MSNSIFWRHVVPFDRVVRAIVERHEGIAIVQELVSPPVATIEIIDEAIPRTQVKRP